MKSGEKCKERKIAVLVASVCSLEAFSDELSLSKSYSGRKKEYLCSSAAY